MSSPSADLDPRITRFSRDASESMSAEHAASILSIGRDAMYDLCHNGVITATALCTAKQGLYKNTRWSITPAALLRYIIHSTTGDRSITLEAIAELCPRWSKRAQAWDKEQTPMPPKWLEKNQKRRTPRAPRTPADPYAGHPDFFRAS